MFGAGWLTVFALLGGLCEAAIFESIEPFRDP